MFCIACGNEIDNGVKFCPSCGAAQQTDSAATHVVEVKKEASVPEYPKVSSDLADKYGKLSTDELLKVAEGKEPIAWVILGNRYQDGEGVEQNNDEAFKWYKKSSDAGEPWGINNLGLAYANAWGVEKDDEKAAELYHQAAKLGWKPAIGNYAWMLENGRGVEKSPEEGMKWYRLGAERGNARCQYNLGRNFAHGVGVEQDDAKAVYWYQKAAKQDHSDALLALGWMHENGRGVEKDPVKGHEFYVKSAELGNAIAMCNVGLDYENDRGVAGSLKKANEWYLKAADAGNDRAMFSLGYNYEKGLGVQKDLNAAKEWYQKAAEKGNKEAEFKFRFADISLRDFGKAPKNVGAVRFQRISGIVLDHKRNSETHVSSYGGGGYVGRYGGHVASAQIESHVTTTDDFWIEDENGNEHHISWTNQNISLRAGQKVSLFALFFGYNQEGLYVLLINHSDGSEHKLNDWKNCISANKGNGIYRSKLVDLCIAAFFYVFAMSLATFLDLQFDVQTAFIVAKIYPLILLWLAFRWLWIFDDKRNVKSGIMSCIDSISSWAKNT